MNDDIRFYWSLLLRRLPVMIVLFALASGLGLGLALTLPPQYRAEAQLLVESPQIPDDLASSTVQTGTAEKLEVIEQRLTTRANLIDLANKFDIFAGQGRLSPDQIVKQMRETISIRASSGRNRATLMRISFHDENPNTAANVVNELVTLVLNEDSRTRTELAGDTLDFFEDEVERLSGELSRLSAGILDFKASNKDTLPEGLDYRLSQQRSLQQNIATAERDIAALEEQRARLIALWEAQGPAAFADENPEARRLARAQAELEEALLVYSDTNPRVRILKAQVAKLENEVAASLEELEAQTGSSLLDLQLAEIDMRIKDLQDKRTEAEGVLDAVNVAIDGTAETGIRLEGLEREYRNIQEQYNSALSRLAKAETGERIELLSKGERMTVLEQATVPTEPASPNRLMIAGGGIAGGIALAVGFFILMEVLNRAIRRPADLVRGLNVQPLATVPYLETTGARHRRRALKMLVSAAILIGTPLALWAIHELYLPLDLIFDRVVAKLGL